MKSRRKVPKKDLFHPRAILTAGIVIVVLGFAFWLQLRGPTLPRGDARYVCMVEDKVHEDQTVPVSIEGATYYACRDHIDQMRNHAGYRTAKDALTGVEIDKSNAVLLQDRDNHRVYYFENEENSTSYMHLQLYGRTDPHGRRNR